MRPRALPVLLSACALAVSSGAAACGGDETYGDQVPKSTPVLTVPGDSEALAEGAGASTTGATTQRAPTTTSPTTSTPAAGGATGTTPSQGTGQGTGGATSQDGGTGAGTGTEGGNADPGTGGSGGTGGASPGNLSQFCQDNPGACPGN